MIVIAMLLSFAHADLYDRIDACEKKGGGSCVYALLRELAADTGKSGSVANKCECSTFERQVGSNCNLGEYLYSMKRDGRSIGGSPCFKNADEAYAACMRKTQTELACR